MRSTPPRRPRHPSLTTRTSYHVGSPWMFDGKMLRAATGTPMRRIARANNPFADAEPEPLTLANLTTKSLMRRSGSISVRMGSVGGERLRLLRVLHAAAIVRLRHVEQELLHVPGAGRAALGAQAA